MILQILILCSAWVSSHHAEQASSVDAVRLTVRYRNGAERACNCVSAEIALIPQSWRHCPTTHYPDSHTSEPQKKLPNTIPKGKKIRLTNAVLETLSIVNGKTSFTCFSTYAISWFVVKPDLLGIMRNGFGFELTPYHWAGPR